MLCFKTIWQITQTGTNIGFKVSFSKDTPLDLPVDFYLSSLPKTLIFKSFIHKNPGITDSHTILLTYNKSF